MQVCLLSVMISKHHATIKRIDEKWTITDENVSILCFIYFFIILVTMWQLWWFKILLLNCSI